MASETAPSPYWFNDDEEVREWVNHHEIAEVGKLSAAGKLTMIKTLMGGWVSDDDVAAIVRICESVTSRVAAEKIRSGVNVVDLSSIGQRTRVRVAFGRMP